MNPCVWFVSVLCWKMMLESLLHGLIGQESEAVCVRSTGALQEVNVDSWDLTMEIRSILDA